MQFAYLKETWGETRNVWIPEYGGFVTLEKGAVPDEAVFEVFQVQRAVGGMPSHVMASAAIALRGPT